MTALRPPPGKAGQNEASVNFQGGGEGGGAAVGGEGWSLKAALYFVLKWLLILYAVLAVALVPENVFLPKRTHRKQEEL